MLILKFIVKGEGQRIAKILVNGGVRKEDYAQLNIKIYF